MQEICLLTQSTGFLIKPKSICSGMAEPRVFWQFLKIWLIKIVPEICTQANVMKTLFYIMKILPSQCITSQVEQLCMQNCLCVHMYTVVVLHTKNAHLFFTEQDLTSALYRMFKIFWKKKSSILWTIKKCLSIQKYISIEYSFYFHLQKIKFSFLEYEEENKRTTMTLCSSL